MRIIVQTIEKLESELADRNEEIEQLQAQVKQLEEACADRDLELAIAYGAYEVEVKSPDA